MPSNFPQNNAKPWIGRYKTGAREHNRKWPETEFVVLPQRFYSTSSLFFWIRMALYEPWQLNVNWENLKAPLLIIVGVVLLALLVWSALVWIEPGPLQVKLNGFINLATTPDGFFVQPNAELEIIVYNPFSEPVHNVSVFVRPQDEKALIVFPVSTKIETLDKSRTLRVSLRPNPAQKVLSGVYLVDVSALIGQQTFSKQVEVEIRNPESQ